MVHERCFMSAACMCCAWTSRLESPSGSCASVHRISLHADHVVSCHQISAEEDASQVLELMIHLGDQLFVVCSTVNPLCRAQVVSAIVWVAFERI